MLTINPDSVPDSPSPSAAPEAPAAAASAPEPENLETEAATAEKPAAEPKKPIPMAWIPATLGVGLLIAVVYLGGRIVTAKAHTAPRAPVVAQKVTPAAPATPPAPVVQPQAQIQAKLDPPSPLVIESKPSPLTYPQPVQQHEAKPPVTEPAKAVAEPKPEAKPAQSPSSEDLADLPTITPQAGERYVQIGALIPKAAHRYLGQLHLAQLKPHIAPGPTPDLVRVVVGPFDDRDVLAAVQAQLDAQRIPNFIRRY